jgi:hypothetical protein
MKKLSLTLAALGALTLAACGAADNVGACNRFKSAAACGTSAASVLAAYSCDGYANLTCDISDYFDCLSTAYVCVNGQYDGTKAQNAAGCASKAICK